MLSDPYITLQFAAMKISDLMDKTVAEDNLAAHQQEINTWRKIGSEAYVKLEQEILKNATV